MGVYKSRFETPLSDQTSSQTTVNVSSLSTSMKTVEQTLLEPIEVITKQRCDESIDILKGRDGDNPAWHIILISYEKRVAFNLRNDVPFIRVEDFGRNIEYRNKAGVICQASGYGLLPPEEFMKWISENYDPCTIDETSTLTYIEDDIRLCTLNKITATEALHNALYYHRHEHFHYIQLYNDQRSTLANHAGLKSFDRIIEYNGINIEDDSSENLKKKINDINEPLLQLLVCSPATYAYYKKSRKHLHSNLSTVRLYNPVRNIIDFYGPTRGMKDFGAVRWESNDSIDIVPLISICGSCLSIQMYEICTIEINDEKRKGQIIFIGSKKDCELLQFEAISNSVTIVQTENVATNSKIDDHEEIDDTLFVTAYQEPLPKPSIVHHSKDEDEKMRKQREQRNLIQQLATLLIDHDNNSENGVAEFHRIQCRACSSLRIIGDRYKCLECSDYDLCGRCFDQRRETFHHLNRHAIVHYSGPDEIFGESVMNVKAMITLTAFKEKYHLEEHIDIGCNICKMNPLNGLRFKCDTCHDYNLCVSCMEKRLHDQSHPLLAIGKSRFLEIPMNDIELGDELGRGGFGTVYKAKWLSKNRQVACKIIRISPDHAHLEKSFRKELAAYTELSGPYILKTYGYNIQELSDGTQKCMLIMEYMSRGSLNSVLKQSEKISLRRKVEMACQIASGMRKLHEHHMIHRDIRPENILVTQDYTAKIGDMGLARVWLPDENLTLIGCVPYMPFDFYTGKYDQSLDVYTFGLTIYHLFTEKRHQYDLLTRRIKLTDVSPIFSDLIAQCLHSEPNKRPSASEIEITLRMYKNTIEKYIHDKCIKYGNMLLDEKNEVFIRIYDALYPVIERALSDKFSSTILHASEASVTL